MKEDIKQIGTWTYLKAANLAADIVASSATFNLMWNGQIDATTNAVERLSRIVGHPIVINEEFPELKGDAIEEGIAIEEIHADLNPPIPWEDGKDNYGEPREQSWRPTFFSYNIAPYYFKYTLKQNQFRNVSATAQEKGLFLDLLLSTTANSVSLYLNSLCRQLLGRVIGYILKAENVNNEVFDPTKEYKNTHLNQDGTKELQYLKKDVNNEVFGVLMHNYDGTGVDKVADWDEAVKKGIINELHLITNINRPGYGTTTLAKKENCEQFIIAFDQIVQRMKTAREGYCLSGVNCGNSIEKPVLYILEDCPSYLKAYIYGNRDNEFRPDLNIKVVADFGKDVDSSVYALLVDPRGIKLHPTAFSTGVDNFAEKGFANFITNYEFRPFVSAHSFVHIFKDPAVTGKKSK